MVTITLKTILNEKVGYHFCHVNVLFWLRQKVVPLWNIKYRSNYECCSFCYTCCIAA